MGGLQVGGVNGEDPGGGADFADEAGWFSGAGEGDHLFYPVPAERQQHGVK